MRGILKHSKKNIMSISQNPFEAKGEQVRSRATDENQKGKIKKMFDHKPHSQRHRKLNAAAKIGTYVSNVVSALTSGSFIAYYTFISLPPVSFYVSLSASILIAAAAVFLIETVKRHAAREVIINAVQYKSFDILLAIVFLITTSVSIICSAYGGALIPKMTAAAPTLINVDSIRQAHDSRIKESTILYTYKPTKTLTRAGAPILAAMQAAKDTEIKEASEKNAAAETRAEKSSEGNSNTLFIIALINEFLFFVFFYFSISYYWKSYSEEAEEEEAPPHPKRLQVQKKEITPNDGGGGPREAPHNQIGFFNNDNRKEVKENLYNDNRTTRTCNHCNRPYTHKHHKQKYCCDACRIAYWHAKKASE